MVLDVVLVATVVIGMAVQASVGFGFGFFVAPAALAAYRPAQAVTLLLFLALLINALILWSEGREREIDPRAAAWLCLWALPGIVAGARVVRHIDASALPVAIGIGIVLAAVFQARASEEPGAARGERPAGVIAGGGFVSGVLTSATSLNGPTVVLTFTRAGLRGHLLRDTAAAVFLVLAVTGTAALALIAHAGHHLPSWVLIVVLVPAVVVGHRLGAALFHSLDPERHRRLVLAAAVVAGTVSIVAGLV
jgi:uncharacterized membrane protein YfcA